MSDKKLPIAGDVVYWRGEHGPQCVIIEEHCFENIYKVRWISGEPLPWTEWTLNSYNQKNWDVLCHLPV